MTVIMGGDGGDLEPTARLGLEPLITAVRRELRSWGSSRVCRRIVQALFAALQDTTGVLAHRAGAFEPVGLLLLHWRQTRDRLRDTEDRMRTVLTDLQLTDLVTPPSPACPPWARQRSWPRPEI